MQEGAVSQASRKARERTPIREGVCRREEMCFLHLFWGRTNTNKVAALLVGDIIMLRGCLVLFLPLVGCRVTGEQQQIG